MSEEQNNQEKIYPLETILDAISKSKNNIAKKRLIFDQTNLEGIGVKWVIAFFISLPIMLYAGIFNPAMFELLGIAQAIIFFVVFLSMVMILIFATTFINNNKVLRQIQPSWDKFFPGVDLKLAISSSATPYKEFFKHYSEALQKELSGEKLEKYLQESFSTMEKENQNLMDAIRRNNNKR